MSEITTSYFPNNDDRERIYKGFTYHPPKGDQSLRYESLRSEFQQLAVKMADYCPPSRELSLAFTKLEEAVMWANAAIARNETGELK